MGRFQRHVAEPLPAFPRCTRRRLIQQEISTGVAISEVQVARLLLRIGQPVQPTVSHQALMVATLRDPGLESIVVEKIHPRYGRVRALNDALHAVWRELVILVAIRGAASDLPLSLGFMSGVSRPSRQSACNQRRGRKKFASFHLCLPKLLRPGSPRPKKAARSPTSPIGQGGAKTSSLYQAPELHRLPARKSPSGPLCSYRMISSPPYLWAPLGLGCPLAPAYR